MLVRQTGEVTPDVYLLNLGYHCNYLAGQNRLTLFDACASSQITTLLSRINEVGVNPKNIESIALTHLHADRAGGIPLLRKQFAQIKLIASPLTETLLRNEKFLVELYQQDQEISSKMAPGTSHEFLPFEEFCTLLKPSAVLREGDLIPLGKEMNARIISSPGHTPHSLSYLIQPSQFLIVDEGFGYFRIKGFTASGADFDIDMATKSLDKILGLELSGLCLPNQGVVTGSLIRRHLTTVKQYTSGMIEECIEAYSINMPENEIAEGVKSSFYADETVDTIGKYNLERSFAAIWPQIQTRAKQQSEN